MAILERGTKVEILAGPFKGTIAKTVTMLGQGKKRYYFLTVDKGNNYDEKYLKVIK